MTIFSGRIPRHKLLKIHSIAENIRDMIRDNDSDYIYPAASMCEARSFLYTDLGRCLRSIREASRRYSRESVLARRYNLIKDRLECYSEKEIKDLRDEYHAMLRIGKYNRARMILDIIFSKRSLFDGPRHFQLSVQGNAAPKVVIRNTSLEQVSIENVMVSTPGKNRIDLKEHRDIWPRQTIVVPLNGAVSGKFHVMVDYYANGAKHIEHYELIA